MAQQVLKKIVRLASVFPSPPFRSSDFAGLRRPRLYGFHTGTRSLSNRKGRGRRSGGREREPRRAGEGRCLELNSCVLIDYRLWAAKSEGRPWVDHCINLYVDHCLSHCLNHCLDHHPEPRSGLCPELLADFRIPKPPGCSQGIFSSLILNSSGCEMSFRTDRHRRQSAGNVANKSHREGESWSMKKEPCS